MSGTWGETWICWKKMKTMTCYVPCTCPVLCGDRSQRSGYCHRAAAGTGAGATQREGYPYQKTTLRLSLCRVCVTGERKSSPLAIVCT
ncbi:unnamed protein product [Lampetra planeri]